MSMYQDYNWKEGSECSHGYLYNDLKLLLGEKDSKIILDIGCGNGSMTNRLIDEKYVCYGTDASITGIAVANKRNNNKFYVQDLTSDNLPHKLNNIKFNTIISTEVIEHLYSPRNYIGFCKKILIKNGGGEIIISTPYHGYFKNLAMAITGKLDAHFTVLWDGGHIKFWSRDTLTHLLEEFGFEIVEFKGSGRYPYLWKSMFIKAKID